MMKLALILMSGRSTGHDYYGGGEAKKITKQPNKQTNMSRHGPVAAPFDKADSWLKIPASLSILHSNANFRC